jgi:hypothetical protein
VGTAVVVFAGGSWIAFGKHGVEGINAVGIAALICGLGAVLALVTTAKLRGLHRALWALLAGTVLRMVLPFGLGLLLVQTSPTLKQAGVLGWMVAFYLPLLLVETVFSVRFLQAGFAGPGTS